MLETVPTKVRRVRHALSLLTPYDIVESRKVRVGRSADGGYVMLSEPQPKTLYSFGVGDEISFEFQLAQSGCRCYLFDHTIAGLPYTHANLSWQKQGLAGSYQPDASLKSVVDCLRDNGDEGRTDLTLKVDVEGHEYEVLSTITDETLLSFTQIAMEIHDLHKLEDIGFCDKFIASFEKLNKSFTLFHAHANNCAPLTFVAGFPVADVLELTYIRSDLVVRQPSTTVYPTYLDCANEPDRQDFPLVYYPFLPMAQLAAEGMVEKAVDAALVTLEFDERLKEETRLTQHQRRVALFGRILSEPGMETPRRTPGTSIINEQPLKILYFACHETLEFDDVRMLTEMGHRVFSVGGLANPDSLKPATRPTSPQFYSAEWWQAFANDPANDLLSKSVSRSFAQHFDIAIVNHDPALLGLNADALAGMPIIFRPIGQSNDHLEASLARYPGVHIVRYSKKEQGLAKFCRTDRVIYFAKFLSDYPQWNGDSGRVITFHNSYPTRASVSVPTLEGYLELARSGPYDLYGFANETVEPWRGLAPAELQLELFRTAGCYLYTYSVPPSYTLSLIEAMLVGVPVVAPSAQAVLTELGSVAETCGFSPERYEVLDLLGHDPNMIWDSKADASQKVSAILSDHVLARRMSDRLRTTAAGMFDVRSIMPQWQTLFESLMSA